MFVICSSTKLFSQQLNRLQIVDDLPLALPLYLLSLDVIFPILSQFLFFGNSFQFLSGPYLSVFGLNTEIYGIYYETVLNPNTGKYGPEKTPYLDTFDAVCEN